MKRDFGDILAEFDQLQDKEKKKKNTNTKIRKEKQDFGSIYNSWEENNDFDQQYKKNKIIDKEEVARVDNTIHSFDLHGYTKEEARELLHKFLKTSYENNWRKLRIIHGQGNHSKNEAVLPDLVAEVLNGCQFVKDFKFSKQSDGGRGSRLVILKARRN